MVDEIIFRAGSGSNIDQIIKKYITEDTECAHSEDHTPGLRRRWACSGCRQLANLKLVDPRVTTKIFNTPITHSKIIPSKIAYIQSIIAKNTNIQSCTQDIESFKRYSYLGMDQATLDIVNRYMIKQTIKPKLSYRCKNSTTVVYDNYPDIDILINESKLNNIIVTSLIEQLVLLCREMSQNKLVHNNPVITSIKIKRHKYHRVEDNISIDSDYELLLDKFELSSGQIGDMRTTNVASGVIDSQPDCKIVVCRSGLTEFSGVCSINVTNTYTSYSLDPKIIDVRKSGLPLFHESLDFYGLLTILMTRKSFYDLVMSDRRLREMWLRMWDPVEYFGLIDKITKQHIEPSSMLSGFDIISGSRLRCDVIDRCIKVLWG